MSAPRQTNAVTIADGIARIDVATRMWPDAAAIVDAEDLGRLLDGHGRWGAHHTTDATTLYAHRTRRANGRRWTEQMHRTVLGLPPSRTPIVDHINGQGLDNRRKNLRTTDQRGNGANSRHGRGTSTFKGVFLRGHIDGSPSWRAGIMVDRHMHWLGTYDTEQAAAAAYDDAARRLCGEFARINLGG